MQLRNTLIDFAHGKTEEITVQTEPGETFVLLSGYPNREIRTLGMSDRLRRRLEAIEPHRGVEIYVLARTKDDDIVEFTEWGCDGPSWYPSIHTCSIRHSGSSVQGYEKTE